MTEVEWLAYTDLTPMLEFLGDRISERKCRLFAFACLRRVWNLLPFEEAKRVIEVAERRLEQRADDETVLRAEAAFYAKAHGHSLELTVFCAAANRGGISLARHVAEWTGAAATNDVHVEAVAQSRLLRDLFGNPFRPVTVDPAWITSTIVSLATSIYDERAFDLMPILADALEDAGCTNQDVLEHCRNAGPHVRGCWVLDLILGKQ